MASFHEINSHKINYHQINSISDVEIKIIMNKYCRIREGKEGQVFCRCEEDYWLMIVQEAHPDIFEILEVMKKEQASSQIKLEQLKLGGRAPPRKKRFIEKDNRFQHCLNDLRRDNTALAIF